MTRRTDLERIRAEGKAHRTNALLVRTSASPHARLRVGIVVPRHRHSAVERNRLKRRLRELVRAHLLPANGSIDIVIWAQRVAYDASFEQLRREVEQVVERLRRAGVVES